MKTIYTVVVLLAASFMNVPAAEPAPARESSPAGRVRLTPEYLALLSEEMRTNHPALRAADARTNAAGASVGAVRTWEDPELMIGGMAAREDMRSEEGDIAYGLQQKLPLFGKPRLERRVAQAELAVAEAEAEYQFQRLRTVLAEAAFQTALAEEVVAVGEQDLSWLETIANTAESKYRAGQATLVEVLQIQNERAKRATQLQTDRDRLTVERLGLNRLLNRNLHATWPSFELPQVAGPIFYNRKLVEFALRYEPRVQKMQREIQQAEATVDWTRRQRLPDITAGLEARNYSGDGSFRQGMLVFNMNLPWVNASKYRSELKRDQAKLDAVRHELADYQLELQEEVHELTVRIDAARREALLYRDEVIPRSESALSSALAGWEANRNTYRDVLEARRMLLEARLMYAGAVTEQYKMMSDLVLCCGLGDLQALQMLGALPDDSEGEQK